jgi:uncharacterized protein GlcG (DUF336 family)
MSRLSLALANVIATSALNKGGELGLKPLTVAVLDSGGHLVLLHRQDGSSNLRPKIAIGKAASALALGVSSRKIAEMAAERPSFVSSLNPIAPDGIIPAAGGVIFVDKQGTPLGAVGITGDTSDNDELCAMAGISTAGMHAQA